MELATANIVALQALIQCLPLPLVALDTHAGSGLANDRFAALFGAESLDSPDLRRLAGTPGTSWQPVTLRNCLDGIAAYARVVQVADGLVVLIFDDGPGPKATEETARLRERIAELEHLSASDALTGAWNRAHLERMVDVEISRANRVGHFVTMILIDIDHFKRVNDVQGHLAGDEVLKEVVARMRKYVRVADSVFRWGGEEFVVLATSVGYQAGATLAERLRKVIASSPFARVGRITASLGVAEYLQGESARQWFERADAALHDAKREGRNRVKVDRRGNSDLQAERGVASVLRLTWSEAYECGEPTIDTAHQQLFDLGNALIAAAIEEHGDVGLWRSPLESTLAHLRQHFHDEEALLRRHGFTQLQAHQRAHAALLARAEELRDAVELGQATLGDLVNFLVNEVIAQHLLKVDVEFFPLFDPDRNKGA